MENAFSPYHASVAAVFFAGATVFTMASMNPACVGVALAGALSCSALVRGARATARTLAWALPLWAVVAAVNGLYSSGQSADAIPLGPFAFGLESLGYGLVAGAMITAVIFWFASAGSCLSGDAALGLVAGRAPTVALMTSQVLGLVPQMLRQGRDVMDAQGACASGSGRAAAWMGRLRVVSVLVGWSMEDGAIRAESMRARAYGSGARRTRYRRRRLRPDDIALAAAIGALGAGACAVAALAGSQFQFYPVVDAQGSWWACLPGAALMLAPFALAARERLRWR